MFYKFLYELPLFCCSVSNAFHDKEKAKYLFACCLSKSNDIAGNNLPLNEHPITYSLVGYTVLKEVQSRLAYTERLPVIQLFSGATSRKIRNCKKATANRQIKSWQISRLAAVLSGPFGHSVIAPNYALIKGQTAKGRRAKRSRTKRSGRETEVT